MIKDVPDYPPPPHLSPRLLGDWNYFLTSQPTARTSNIYANITSNITAYITTDIITCHRSRVVCSELQTLHSNPALFQEIGCLSYTML